ncbi:MAG: hypothetical protein HW405_370 [Candidatus Berkelbacteria bacterium]|nr:hypothetical protein [Candidatus Berkelbacteria bacterium]
MDKRYIILGLAVVLLIVFGTLWFLSSRKPKSAEINFVTYSEDEKNLESLVANFESKNPGVKINIIKKDLANYEVDSLNLIATNKIDVWGIPVSWLAKQHNKLSSAPTTLKDYQKVYPKSVSLANTINNNVYGYPLSLDTLVLFANSNLKYEGNFGQILSKSEQDLMGKDPTNWDDLTAQVRLITSKQDTTITRSGLAMGTSAISAAPDILTLMMLQNGTQITNDNNTQATFHTALNKFGGDSYPAASALDLYTSFSKSTNNNYSYSDTMGDALRTFSAGKAVYYIDYKSKESDIKRINPELDFTILPIPQVKETKNPVNYLDYEIFTVPSSSPNQTLAWNFLQYLADPANLTDYYVNSQRTPATISGLENAGNKISTAVDTALTWYNPDLIEVDKIFRGMINEVAIANKSSQTVLEGAALKVTALLEQIK